LGVRDLFKKASMSGIVKSSLAFSSVNSKVKTLRAREQQLQHQLALKAKQLETMRIEEQEEEKKNREHGDGGDGVGGGDASAGGSACAGSSNRLRRKAMLQKQNDVLQKQLAVVHGKGN
jgi:hypothetical protein